MEENSFKKIGFITAFFVFAAVSCWATEESLHLLLPSWPAVFCWAVTIGFFIIASLGTKLIVDSFNQEAYIEHRGAKLIWGFILVVIFWLICSMPTNTHTFFYRSAISDMVNNDVAMTRGYIGQIQSNTKNKEHAKLAADELRSKVESKLLELKAEIENEINPGDGTESRRIRQEIASLLGVDRIEKISGNASSKQARAKLYEAYRSKIINMVDTKCERLINDIMTPNEDNLREAKTVDRNLELMKQYIDDETISLFDPNDMADVCDKLNQGYNVVKKNKQFVSFASEADEQLYTADIPVTKVRTMLSVKDVWLDFIDGKYAGYGFIFWIVIAILVDVAAFIFFDLAFKKSEY